MASRQQFRLGDIVSVPWGLEEPRRGKIIEVWGNPPAHVRVQILDDEVEGEPPVVLLLSPSVLSAA